MYVDSHVRVEEKKGMKATSGRGRRPNPKSLIFSLLESREGSSGTKFGYRLAAVLMKSYKRFVPTNFHALLFTNPIKEIGKGWMLSIVIYKNFRLNGKVFLLYLSLYFQYLLTN
ncbi:hypothetical protein C5167_039630 [Papaver somniferum]|uniref:Uncharacterized protein n=1 Tax=Papaver somniferum TaxID=3469 RepID=A0A4Y7IG44_PAPSO|nr:hypothetical protein C5167_039630 [Papaver somniferum]